MRLQKYLALCGVASRRSSEELIKAGHVMVNNSVIQEMGFIIDPDKDVVKVKGAAVVPEEEKLYIMMNKPTGYVTTVSDQFNRSKVVDLVEVKERVYPVGRLDYNTSGLLLLTNDGDLAYRLTHPKFKVEKVYIAKIKGRPTAKEMKSFESGLQIEDYITSPAKIRIIKELQQETLVEIMIREGRNRQVRRMCDAIGHPVTELKRMSIGELQLGDLPLGKWRYLLNKELQYLKNL